MQKINLRLLCLGLAVFLSLSVPVYAEKEKPAEQDFIGEFSGWGTKVPRGNYYMIKGAIIVFGTRWGAQPQTEQELEDRVWEQLVLSYEAFRREVKVEEKEVNDEIDKLLSSENVKFDRKKDRQAYVDWIRNKAREPVDVFENQLRHLIQLENLRKEVLESFKPQVSEEEAHQKFLNEYNSLELELVQFDELDKAKDFYAKMQDAKLWEEEKKKNPKFAQHPGFVSLEFLIEMWKIPKDDLYKMLDMAIDSVYPPIPVYKGYGVMRILKKRIAEEKDFTQRREYYFKQVEAVKKYAELKEWLKRLKQEADIRVYPQPAG